MTNIDDLQTTGPQGPGRPLLWCEEFFLLLTKDSGGQVSGGQVAGGALRKFGLVACVVADLCATGRVSVGEDRHHRVQVVDPSPIGDPVLDPVLERLRTKNGKRFSDLVRDARMDPQENVVGRLAQESILEIAPRPWGWLSPAKFPVRDPRPEAAVRTRLAAALTSGEALDGDATLLSVLAGLKVEYTVLHHDVPELSRRQLRRRIEEVVGNRPAGDAAAAALKALTAAIAASAAVMASTSAMG